jgi:ribosomal protein S18 acetylase RimI-like enzyme
MKPEFDIQVRSATYDDLPEVVSVNVAAWREAYVGQVPQDYLDNLDVSQKLKEWQDRFVGNADGEQHLDLAFINKEMVGFIAYGRGRDEGAELSAEIYAAYLIKDYWGQGVGYSLFQIAKKTMIKNGYSEAYLWVLMENYRAISAYQKWGGIPYPLSVKEIVIYGRSIQEIAVKFPKL